MNIKTFDLYNPYTNKSVTEFYVKIIEDAILRCGMKTRTVNKLSKSDKNYGIVIVHPKDYLIAKKNGYKKVVLWVQGVTPEESYLRNHSILRKLVLSLRELPGIKKADIILMVSERMKKHYEDKYHIDFGDRVMFMPCFNSELDESCFDVPGKYEKNVFTYAGATEVWQCFDDTIRIYSEVERKIPDSEMWVYTKDKEKARETLEKYGVKNYKIDFVTPKQLEEELKKVKFGFVLRQDDIVNNVATPTKISSYMASGVIPIFGEALNDFKKNTAGMEYIIPLSEFKADSIIQFCKKDVNLGVLKKEFTTLFDTYFNKEKYIEEIIERLKKG